MRQGREIGISEKIVSFILLGCIVLVGLGVFIRQFYYDSSRFGPEQAGNTGGTANATAIGTGFEIPPPPGFKPMGKPDAFDSDTLSIKIDGKADLYLTSGFKQLVCQQFVSEKDENAWIEFYAYDMGVGRNAFSVYSVQKRPEGADVNVADLAYKTPDAVFMCVGKYYCETIGSNVSEELLEAMLAASKNFVKTKAQAAGTIEEIELFPKDGLVKGTYKLYLTDAYGYAGFTNTFSAAYNIGGKEVTAFIYPAGDPNKAQSVAMEYANFVKENGGTIANTTKPDLQGSVFDLGGMYEMVFAQGKFVAGIHEADDQASAEAVAAALRERLKQANTK